MTSLPHALDATMRSHSQVMQERSSLAEKGAIAYGEATHSFKC
ncbi:hypothetical protein [Phormidesmis priestleyi]|nr:hypothetical protein [Phormidesmis priestleyi]